MTRDKSNAMWRARWEKADEAGLTMYEYAKREGFSGRLAYRWRQLAIRSGRWPATAKSSKAVTVAKPPLPVQFARVMVSEAPLGHRATVLRLTLANGRRAELDVDIADLGQVIEMLERSI